MYIYIYIILYISALAVQRSHSSCAFSKRGLHHLSRFQNGARIIFRVFRKRGFFHLSCFGGSKFGVQIYPCAGIFFDQMLILCLFWPKMTLFVPYLPRFDPKSPFLTPKHPFLTPNITPVTHLFRPQKIFFHPKKRARRACAF